MFSHPTLQKIKNHQSAIINHKSKINNLPAEGMVSNLPAEGMVLKVHRSIIPHPAIFCFNSA